MRLELDRKKVGYKIGHGTGHWIGIDSSNIAAYMYVMEYDMQTILVVLIRSWLDRKSVQ